MSSQENDPRILGSYVGPQGTVNGLADVHSVAAVGNGDMWVAAFGEDIERGDFLISSAVAGHARKDPRSAEVSYVIARAAEDVRWADRRA